MTEAGGLRMGTAAGRWVLATTVLGTGIVMIDGTVVNVALARIGHDLDAGFSDLQWTVNAYALAGRIGPRLPMTIGSLVSACGLLLLLRIGPDATWLADVLPAMIVFGVGMTLTVSPLTATVLDAAPDRFAGSASGVNNAVARAAGLLAVAIIPGIAGITGDAYADPAALNAGFRMSVLISAGLVVAAAVVSFVFIRRARTTPAVDRVRVEECFRCEVTAPMPHPADR